MYFVNFPFIFRSVIRSWYLIEQSSCPYFLFSGGVWLWKLIILTQSSWVHIYTIKLPCLTIKFRVIEVPI